MLFLELHLLRVEKPVQVNPNAIIFYEPMEDDHCRLWVYGGKATRMIEVAESYAKVNDIVSKFEFVNEHHWMATQVGTYHYLDFLQNEESNPLRDEYLRWKGMHKLASKEASDENA